MYESIFKLKEATGNYTSALIALYLAKKGQSVVQIKKLELMAEFEINKMAVADSIKRLQLSKFIELISYNSGCYTLKITNFLNEVKQPTEPIEAQPVNPPKRVSKIAQKQDSNPEPDPMHTPLRKVFEDVYFDQFQIPFYWDARCAKGLNPLIGKLRFTWKEKRRREGLPEIEPDAEELGKLFTYVIVKCPDFHKKQISPHYLNNHYDAILTEIRTKQQPSQNMDRAGRFAAAKLPVP